MLSFAAARRMMVDGQVRTNDVTDSRILAAMERLPREDFVPPSQAALAYLDRDLPVTDRAAGGTARYLLKPMVLAKLIHAAAVGPTDRVLDVACATGYSTALLAHLASSVVGLEEEAGLAALAERNMRALGLNNVLIRTGPLVAGAAAAGPFDVIVINGAVDRLPEALFGPLGLIDVRAGPVPARDLALLVANWNSAGEKPSIVATRSTQPVFDLVMFAGLDAMLPIRQNVIPVFRVQVVHPFVPERLFQGQTELFGQLTVHVSDGASLVRSPDQLRHRIGKFPQSPFALTQRIFRLLAGGDVGRGTEPFNDFAVGIQ